MRYHNITKDDMLNGDGLRVVLWVSGCAHCCKEDVYKRQQDAEVLFYRYLRPERKFASLPELKGQLDVDVQKGRAFFKAFDN